MDYNRNAPTRIAISPPFHLSPVMDTSNCSLPAPPIYRNVMHFSHLVTFPIYFAVLVALFLDSSNALRTYKYYLMVQVIINVLAEVYISFFMLPVTYLPHPLLRTTGWLSELGFSGLFQFYCLTGLIGLMVGSILEMFYFRFKVCIIFYRNHPFTKVFKVQVLLYRFITIIVHPLIAGVTFYESIEVQQKSTKELWLSKQTLPPEITCYSVFIAVPHNYVFEILMSIYVIQIFLAITGSIGPVIYITQFITKGVELSPSARRTQKKMVYTLILQGVIHGFFLITPLLFLIDWRIFNSSGDELANFLFICFAYRGFPATCAMIVFTKQVRRQIFSCFKRQGRKHRRVGSILPCSTREPQSQVSNNAIELRTMNSIS